MAKEVGAFGEGVMTGYEGLATISAVILLIFQGISVKKNFIATPSVMGETIARVRAYILDKV